MSGHRTAELAAFKRTLDGFSAAFERLRRAGLIGQAAP